MWKSRFILLPEVAVSGNVRSIPLTTGISGAIVLPIGRATGIAQGPFRVFSSRLDGTGLDVGAFPVAQFPIPVEGVALVFQADEGFQRRTAERVTQQAMSISKYEERVAQ